jgi:antirestriction protein ArdC
MNVYEIVTERIVDYIEKNQVLPWTKPWACVGNENASQNFKSKHAYSGVNAILTGMSGYASPYWLTFKQAKEMGGVVRKEEKATPVVYWNTVKKKEEDDESEDGSNKPKKFGFHKMFFVFNEEQIDGIDFPDLPVSEVQEFSPLKEAERVFKNMQNRPMLVHGGASAFYSPGMDRVVLPEQGSFVAPAEYYSALFHEVAHSTGHPSRLNRFAQEADNHKFGSQSYSKEELVAEISSAFILNTVGINTESSDRNSAAYIKSWLKALRNDPRMIVSASSKACIAADYIMGITQSKEYVNV